MSFMAMYHICLWAFGIILCREIGPNIYKLNTWIWYRQIYYQELVCLCQTCSWIFIILKILSGQFYHSMSFSALVTRLDL